MTEQGDVVRFAVDMGFFMCGNDIFYLDMPMCEKLLYIALCRYAGSNNRAWLSHATLCRDLSCGRTRLSEAVQYLCDSGLVKKEGRGNRTNVYSLYPVSHFKKPCFKKKLRIKKRPILQAANVRQADPKKNNNINVTTHPGYDDNDRRLPWNYRKLKLGLSCY